MEKTGMFYMNAVILTFIVALCVFLVFLPPSAYALICTCRAGTVPNDIENADFYQTMPLLNDMGNTDLPQEGEERNAM